MSAKGWAMSWAKRTSGLFGGVKARLLRKRSARPRTNRDLRIESLESRILLSQAVQQVAADVFAQLSGQVPAGGNSQLTFTLNTTDATIPNSSAILGFQTISGGSLNPAAVQITNSGGSSITPIYSNTGLASNSQSIFLATLPYGTYTLSVSGVQGTSGPFSLAVFLAGDVNGDRKVDISDGLLMRQLNGSAAGGATYTAAADFNLDGKISSFDYTQWNRNVGVQLSTPPATPAPPVFDPNTPNSGGVTAITTPTFDGTAPFGDTVELLNGSAVLGTANVNANGTWSITSSALSNGQYNLTAEVIDGFQNTSPASAPLSVTINTQPPAAPAFALSTADDPTGSGQTMHNVVALVGQSSPGVQVSLASQNLTTTAGVDGTFTLHGAVLSLGADSLTLTANNGIGAISTYTATVTRLAPQTANQVALDWNTQIVNAIQVDASTPEYASRSLAIVSAAMYDSENSVSGASSDLYVHIAAPANSSDIAAVAQAAHDTLVYLYPAQKTTFDTQLATSLASVTNATAKANGVNVGQQVAAAIIAMRVNDGSTTYVSYTPGTGPGVWQPTYPAYMPAENPQWATLQPFLMTSDSQFRPAGPPALGSAQWEADYNQVMSLGASNSTTRTADQTQIAKFWNDATGTATPPGHWNMIANLLAGQKNLSLADTTKMFAEMNVAMGDATIVAWDAKFTDNFWRPITAIQAGGDDANLKADQNWNPLINTPPFPEYISGHSTFSSAAATVLNAVFGPNTPFTIGTTSPGVTGVTRSFTGFDQAANEAAMSRIYGGIHFNTSVQDGLTAGTALGQYVLQRFSDLADTTPPAATYTSPQNPAIKANTNITGLATDNLSGVQSLLGQFDGGSTFAVTLDASGHFSIPTTFALDGSADGSHVLHLIAKDYAGNTSNSYDYTFTLDTKVPTITVTSPALGVGQTGPISIAAGTMLTGTADGTGSTLVALSYKFDSGTVMPFSFGADGSFNQTLDLSKLSTGGHALTVTATDSAGNITITSLSVMLPVMAPLLVSSFTPITGSSNIGATYRPEVFFSRPIKTSTLNGTDFFLTDSTGTKVATTIVPSDDGTYAWLFPTTAMPGASTMTVTVDGTQIKSADGAFLDAAGKGSASGSKLTYNFSTVSVATLPNTSLSGVVADPGPDLKPGTKDDVSSGADNILGTTDDVYKLPIAGVTVSIVGTSLTAITDSQGRFSFASVPSGDLKLEVDGTTATNAPTGYYFPQMVMDLNILPGVANTVMSAMQGTGNGNSQPGATLPTALGVYLPRVATSILQTIAPTGMTNIGVDAISAPDLTPQQRSDLSINVPAGVAIGANGQKMTNFQVGISVVPAALVMDMLPPGVMQHTFDITVQAPGVATFSTPVQMTFPNVFNAAPGTKLNFLSFDHTTGRLVIEGTATVSADGLSVTTDPGTGITHPGWHGMTPPGNQTQNQNPQCPAGPAVSSQTEKPPTPTPHYVPLLTGDTPTVDDLNNFTSAIAPPPDGYERTVTVKVDPQIQHVLQDGIGIVSSTVNAIIGVTPVPIKGGTWTLTSDSNRLQFDWSGISDADLKQAGLLETFSIYGGAVTIDVKTAQDDNHAPMGVCPPSPKPPTETIDQFFLYRYLNPVYAVQSEFGVALRSVALVAADVVPFPDAVKAGLGGSTQQQAIHFHVDRDAALMPSVDGAGFSSDGGNSIMTVMFAPARVGQFPGHVQLGHGIALNLAGTGTARQVVYVNEPALVNEIAAIRDGTLSPLTTLPYESHYKPDEMLAFADPQFVADTIFSAVQGYFKQSVGDAIDVEPGAGTDGSEANYDSNTLLDRASYALGFTGLDTGLTIYPYGSNIDNLGDIQSIIADYSLLGNTVTDYLLPQAINASRAGSMTIFLVSELLVVGSIQDFEAGVAKDIAHELGHTMSLVHLSDRPNQDSGSPADIMSYNTSGPYAFTKSLDALQLGLDQTVTDGEVSDAASYFSNSHNDGGSDIAFVSGSVSGNSTLDFDTPLPIAGKHITVSQANTLELTNNVDFGDQNAVGSSAIQNLLIENVGSDPVTITKAMIAGSSDFVAVLPPGFAGQLAPGASVQLGIQYTATAGPAQGTVTIESDAMPITLTLTGQGTIAASAAQIDNSNNNLGGAVVGESVENDDAITINNYGSSPLAISGISLSDGSASFSVNGLPADLAANPITVAPGESYSLSMDFHPIEAGLARGVLQLTTNDPAHPTLTTTVVGTGALSDSVGNWGGDYVSISFPSLGDNSTVRLMSDMTGNFSAFLPASTVYNISVFDPKSGLIAKDEGVTGRSGTPIDLTSMLTFKASTAPDSDGDGIPDDIKACIGISLTKPNANANGVDDFTALQEGLNPVSTTQVNNGVIASLPLQGQAHKVVLTGSLTNSAGQTAYVATGSYGLAIVDASQLTKPIVLAQIQLPGNSTDVSVDTNLNIAAVASGTALNLVDVSNANNPKLLFSIPINATQVQVLDGVAYVAVQGGIQAYDLVSRELLNALPISSGTITGLARDGSELYATDSTNTLHAVEISGFQLIAQGSLSLPVGSGQLSVNNGIAYVSSVAPGNPNQIGFSTVNVSNPNQMTLIAGPSAINLAGLSVAPNGSGLGVSVGYLIGQGGVLDVENLSDPTNTGAFETRYFLPAPPLNVTIASGIAYVADGSGGFQVLNYEPFDTTGIPPTASISTTAGSSVIEGSTVNFTANVSDNVQVRNVELLVDGTVVQNAVSAPFDLSAIMPLLASGISTVTVQFEAIDTGGNIGMSNKLTFNLVKDTVPPTITSTNPANGGVRGKDFQTIQIQFSKPLDPSSVTSQNFYLEDPSGNVITPLNLELRTDGTVVQITAPTPPAGGWPAGVYSFVINSSAVTDRAGNVLGSSNYVSRFNVISSSAVWINPNGGDWSNPANWDGGVLPGNNDDVFIEVPGNPTITFSNGSVQIRSLVSENAFILSGGTLSVSQTVEVDHQFTISGGTLKDATVLPARISPGPQLPFTSGQLGNALQFDGSTNYVDMGNPADHHLDLGTNATLEVWVKFDAVPSGSFATFMTKDAGSGSLNKWIFGYANNYGGISNATMFQIYTTGRGSVFLHSNNWTPTVGQWYHIAVVKAGNNYTFYLNGVANGTTSTTIAVPQVASDFLMGQAEGGFRMQGALDDARVWNIARTTTDIQSDFNQELVGNEAGLVGYWKYDEGNGTIAHDSTANGSNGTINGNVSPLFSITSGTLDGVTLNTDVGPTASGSNVHVLNGLILNGTATLGPSAAIYFDAASQTLGGTGTVVFNSAQGLITNANNMTLTIGAGITILGGNNPGNPTVGAIIGSMYPFGGGQNTSIINQGTIDANVPGIIDINDISTGIFTNTGTIEATNGGTLNTHGLTGNLGKVAVNGSGSVLSLDGSNYVNNLGVTVPAGTTLTLKGTWSNAGGLTINAGTLNLGGSFVLANLGTINRTGGTVYLFGTLTNTGTTLALNATTGSWILGGGGTILNGMITSNGGAELLGGGGTLSGVTVNANLDLTAFGANVHVLNGLTLNTTVTLGYGSFIYFDTASQTLGGTGTVVFTADGTQGLIANADNTTLTIGAGITIRGGSTFPYNFAGSVIGYLKKTGPDNSAIYGGRNTSVINNGTINADTAGTYIVIQPNSGTFTNAGTIEATNGGTFVINTSVSNAGSINSGGNGSAGQITVAGNFAQTSAGILDIDLGGTVAGTQFDQLAVTGSATLNGTVNVSLINGYSPAAGATFQFLTFGSHTGSFATINDTNTTDTIGFGVSYGATAATITTMTVVPTALILKTPSSAQPITVANPVPPKKPTVPVIFIAPCPAVAYEISLSGVVINMFAKGTIVSAVAAPPTVIAASSLVGSQSDESLLDSSAPILGTTNSVGKK